MYVVREWKRREGKVRPVFSVLYRERPGKEWRAMYELFSRESDRSGEVCMNCSVGRGKRVDVKYITCSVGRGKREEGLYITCSVGIGTNMRPKKQLIEQMPAVLSNAICQPSQSSSLNMYNHSTVGNN